VCISWTNKGLNTINMHGATMKNACNVVDSAIVTQWQWLFVNGCECWWPIYIATKLAELCLFGINATESPGTVEK